MKVGEVDRRRGNGSGVDALLLDDFVIHLVIVLLLFYWVLNDVKLTKYYKCVMV